MRKYGTTGQFKSTVETEHRGARKAAKQLGSQCKPRRQKAPAESQIKPNASRRSTQKAKSPAPQAHSPQQGTPATHASHPNKKGLRQRISKLG